MPTRRCFSIFLNPCTNAGMASRAEELREGSALIVVCEVMSYSAHWRKPPGSVYGMSALVDMVWEGMVLLLTKYTSNEGQDGRMCRTRVVDSAYMNANVSMYRSRLGYLLNILNIFCNSGPGSLSLTTTWNNRRCTMSYIPTKCSGSSPSASSCCIVTFGGSH